MSGTTARSVVKTPVRLVATISAHDSSVTSNNGTIPALASASRLPNSSNVR